MHASIQRCKAVHVANTQRVTTLHYEQQLGTHSSSGRAARAVRTTRNNEEAQAHLESGNNEERYGQGTTRNDGEQWGGMGSDEAEKAPTGNGREGGLPPRDLCRSFRAYTLSSRLTERKRLTDSPKMLKSYTLYKGVSDAATLSGSWNLLRGYRGRHYYQVQKKPSRSTGLVRSVPLFTPERVPENRQLRYTLL